LYLKNFYGQELLQGCLFVTKPPLYTDGLYFQNNVGGNYRGSIISFAQSWEASFNNMLDYNANGGLASTGLSATGLGSLVVHCINSDVDVTKFDALYVGKATNLREKSFKVTVADGLGNKLENATVKLMNKNANALFRITDVVLDTTPNISATATSLPFITDHGLSVGDIIRISGEEMRVTSITTSKIAVVTRGVNGTVGLQLTTGSSDYMLLAIAENGATDVNGECEYASSGNGKNAVVQEMCSFYGGLGIATPVAGSNVVYDNEDFFLEIHKSGYKPYKAPIDMSGYIGKDISIRLKNRRFVEQISR